MPARLSEEERQARVRLRLITPSDSRKVISKDIYWTRQFLKLYLDLCDQVAAENPREALSLAHNAIQLADSIGQGQRPGEYSSETQERSFKVFAAAVVATVHRAAGEPQKAQEAFKLAYQLQDNLPIANWAAAELLSRQALLLWYLNNQEKAFQNLNQALELFNKAGDPSGSAATLGTRAILRYLQKEYGHALEDISSSFSYASRTPTHPRSKRVLTAGVTNLARFLAEGNIPNAESRNALPMIHEARKSLSRTQTYLKLQLLWAEASLNRTIQCPLQAARLFTQAREGFRTLGLAGEYCQVSLEFAVTLLEEGEKESLALLRKDTLETIENMTSGEGMEPLLLQTLEAWTVESKKKGLLQLKQTLSGL